MLKLMIAAGPPPISVKLIFAALLFGTAAATEEAAVIEPPSHKTERTPVHTVVPVYPEKARRERLEGEVQVCYHVDKKGRPYRIAVRNSSHRVFERPSIVAVRASTYAPLAPGEQRSGIKTCRTFRFTLEPVEDAGSVAQDTSQFQDAFGGLG